MGRGARRLVAVLLAAGLVTGCSSDTGTSSEEGESSPSSPTEPTTTLTPTSIASNEPSEDLFAPNVGDRALRIGDPRKGRSFTTTLQEVRLPYPPAPELFREPQNGFIFVGFRVRQCYDGEPADADFNISSSVVDWFVGTPAKNQVQGNTGWTDWPQPRFPENVTLNPGDCLKGWITAEVPANTRLEKVIYRPGGQTVAEWLP